MSEAPWSRTVVFSGTREPTSGLSRHAVELVNRLPSDVRVVTGACIGIDALVARTAHARGLHVHTVVPGNRSRVDPEWREHCDTKEELPAGTSYRVRNERMVALMTEPQDTLYALPLRPVPVDHGSGTWMTVNIARSQDKTAIVVADTE